MKKRWLILLLAAILFSYVAYKYIYKDHRDIASESSAFNVTSAQLLNEFESSNSNAQKKYLNTTITVSGKISSIEDKAILLDGILFCNFENNIINKTLKLNEELKIKGRCIGYDDLLGEIKLDQCIINN